MISLEAKAMMQVTTRLLEAQQTIYDLWVGYNNAPINLLN